MIAALFLAVVFAVVAMIAARNDRIWPAYLANGIAIGIGLGVGGLFLWPGLP